MKKSAKILLTLLSSLIFVMAFATVAFGASKQEMDEEGQVIDLNTWYTGYVNPGEETYYKFDITEKGYFQVETKLSAEMGDPDKVYDGWKVYVYDSSMEELASYSITKGVITWPLSYGTGTYYVKLVSRKEYWWTGGYPNTYYDIRASFTKTSYFETEYNDSMESANPIKPGYVYTGRLSYSSDNDYFKFTVAEKCKYNFDIGLGKNGETDYVQFGWDFTLYNQNKEAIYQKREIGSTQTTENMTLNAGTYYIRIDANWDMYYPYTYYDLKVNKVFEAPQLVSVENSLSGIKFSWTKSSGATGYYVYRKTDGKAWSKVATINKGTTLSYFDKNVVAGTKYYYTVRAFDATRKSGCNTTGKSVVRLTEPTFKVNNAYSGMTISWDKVKGASQYIVYKKATTARTWSKVATVTTTSWTDKSVYNGSKYQYTVKAVNGYSVSSMHNGKTMYRVTSPSLKRVTNSSAGKAVVTWSKSSIATGYQIRYATKSDMSNAMTASNTSNVNSKTIFSLKKGKTYYVQVRTYVVKYGVKYYSGWSNKKTVKIVK